MVALEDLGTVVVLLLSRSARSLKRPMVVSPQTARPMGGRSARRRGPNPQSKFRPGPSIPKCSLNSNTRSLRKLAHELPKCAPAIGQTLPRLQPTSMTLPLKDETSTVDWRPFMTNPPCENGKGNITVCEQAHCSLRLTHLRVPRC